MAIQTQQQQLQKRGIIQFALPPGTVPALVNTATGYCAHISDYSYNTEFLNRLLGIAGSQFVHATECVGIFRKDEHSYSKHPVYYAKVIDISDIYAMNETLTAVVPFGAVSSTEINLGKNSDWAKVLVEVRGVRKLKSLSMFHAFMESARANKAEYAHKLGGDYLLVHESSSEFSVIDGILVLTDNPMTILALAKS